MSSFDQGDVSFQDGESVESIGAKLEDAKKMVAQLEIDAATAKASRQLTFSINVSYEIPRLARTHHSFGGNQSVYPIPARPPPAT